MKTNNAVQISSLDDIVNLNRPVSYSLPPEAGSNLRLVPAGADIFAALHGKEQDCCNRATD